MSKGVINKNISQEMESSFLDYAMSVIVSRALPDVRDGLKPVHRRILFAMNDLGNYADKPYKKSARIVGDVIGKYHPHGDSSVYDAMVRMAQDFSYRLELVDGHGNFGSIDGDGAAAMRYTEARMSKAAMELLRDINKDTIDYQENYDGSELEPVVLPSKIPNILINGASGIAVGMATSIPPHNLGEVVDGAVMMLDNDDITIEELCEVIKGPDFPLGAKLLGVAGAKKAYETGNGSVRIRSTYEIFKMDNGKSMIIFSEIPFQVNKSLLLERTAEAVKNKVIEGITDIRDESDKDGIRVVIELSRDATPEVVVNNLFKHTQFEVSFSMNMLALVGGKPEVLNLKDILKNYLKHQIEVITRRTQFDLNKANKRAHILEGLKIAVDNVDQVIKLIRASHTTEEAAKALMDSFDLSETQTKAILEMRLQKLTGLETDKIVSELNDLLKLIEELKGILADDQKIKNIIKEELLDIKDRFNTPRRTEILYDYVDSGSDYESLIEEQDVLITLTKSGYIKRTNVDGIRVQNRGGKGSKGITLNEEDEVNKILYSSTHSDLLFFTDKGQVFKTRAYNIPEYASKGSKGIPIVNIINIEKDAVITSIISIKEYSEGESLFFVTKLGRGKKTSIKEYTRINKNGKRAITLNDGDEVVGVSKIKNNEDAIFIATRDGFSIKSGVEDFRSMGRTAKGVTAIRFKDSKDEVVGFSVVNDDTLIITTSEKGFGKMTPACDYRTQCRGGKGTKNLKVSEKTGKVREIIVISSEKQNDFDLVILTQKGQSMRMPLANLKSTGRNTQGVRLMNINDNDMLNAVELIELEKDEDNEIED